MAEETIKKTYLGKPQLRIEKEGKIVVFTCPKKEHKFYVLLKHLQALVWGHCFYLYANEFIPDETIRAFQKARGDKQRLEAKNLSPTEPIKP